MTKIINHNRLRLWIYSSPRKAQVWRKVFKRLGYILWLGRFRLSFTLIR